MCRLMGVVLTIVVFIFFTTIVSQAQDGVTLTDEVVPRGKTPPREMQPEDWSDPNELKRTWDGAKMRISLATGAFAGR